MICGADRVGVSKVLCASSASTASKPSATALRNVESTQNSVCRPQSTTSSTPSRSSVSLSGVSWNALPWVLRTKRSLSGRASSPLMSCHAGESAGSHSSSCCTNTMGQPRPRADAISPLILAIIAAPSKTSRPSSA